MLDSSMLYILILLALALAGIAQFMTKRKFETYSQVAPRSGMTGEQAARRILDSAGLTHVRIEHSRGFLSDHYDPRAMVLRLSEATMHSSSIAAVGVAAHEAGHAIQHRDAYAPLMLRNLCASTTGFGSRLAWPLFLIGLFINSPILIGAGIVLYGMVFLFTLITLPVEYNASGRALAYLTDCGILAHDEMHGAQQVLSAAAKTYLASALMAAVQLLRVIAMAKNSRSRD